MSRPIRWKQYKTFEVLGNMESLPEAFICANDKIAMTVIKALQQNGKWIPQDISVVGFDNCDLAMLSTPTIATVDNFLDEQARSAVCRLLRRLKEPQLPHERILYLTEFVDGESLRKRQPHLP